MNKGKRILVDVGARSFRWGEYKDEQPFDEVHLVEADKAAHGDLLKTWATTPDFFFYNIALSNYTGIGKFYITNKADCSSLLKPNDEILLERARPRTDLTNYKVESVNVDTLDNVFADLPYITLLKLDTQGSEYEILQGAERILPRVQKIWCEANHDQWYQRQKVQEDIVEFLESHGFKIYKIRKLSAFHSEIRAENCKL